MCQWSLPYSKADPITFVYIDSNRAMKIFVISVKKIYQIFLWLKNGQNKQTRVIWQN